MAIAHLIAEHGHVLEVAAALERIVAGPRPEAAGLFTLARANFVREVLGHSSRDDSMVIVPLMGDRRPHIAHLAAQSRTQLHMLCDDIVAHMEHWNGLPDLAQWPQYRREVEALTRRLRARFAAEESGIYHFLPARRADHQGEAIASPRSLLAA